jgi:putative tricarboxylic transport membrane protein
LGAFLAVPSLINVSKSLSENKIDLVTDKTQHEEVKFSWASSLRGTTLGIFLGMVPLIGTMISSNVAWAFEKLFSKKKNLNQQSLNRLLAAESSNNSAAVTVLIPLLILGLAIIPSEMLLLSIIESVGWHPKNVTGDFYIKLYSALIAACLISYLFCYTFVIPFTKLFYKNFKILLYITFVIIVGSVYYSGSMYSNQIFFILCLSVFSFVVLLTYKYFDFIPLVAGYLLSSEVLNTTQIIHNLYF